MNHLEYNAPNISFHPVTEKYINENIINPPVEKFLRVRGSSLKEAIRIEGRKSITDLNFKKVKIQYIYKNLLGNVKKRDTDDFVWAKYYTITFDEKLATKKCSDTGLMFNEMSLGKIPILFFIYFDLQKILDSVRSQAKGIKER